MPADPGWRSQVIQVRCSPEEKAEWGSLAASAGLALSEWVRRRCDAGLDAGVAQMPALTFPASGERAKEREHSAARLGTPSPASSPERSFRPDPKGGSK